jgi:hypothetical protein
MNAIDCANNCPNNQQQQHSPRQSDPSQSAIASRGGGRHRWHGILDNYERSARGNTNETKNAMLDPMKDHTNGHAAHGNQTAPDMASGYYHQGAPITSEGILKDIIALDRNSLDQDRQRTSWSLAAL